MNDVLDEHGIGSLMAHMSKKTDEQICLQLSLEVSPLSGISLQVCCRCPASVYF